MRPTKRRRRRDPRQRQRARPRGDGRERHVVDVHVDDVARAGEAAACQGGAQHVQGPVGCVRARRARRRPPRRRGWWCRAGQRATHWSGTRSTAPGMRRAPSYPTWRAAVARRAVPRLTAARGLRRSPACSDPDPRSSPLLTVLLAGLLDVACGEPPNARASRRLAGPARRGCSNGAAPRDGRAPSWPTACSWWWSPRPGPCGRPQASPTWLRAPTCPGGSRCRPAPPR